jgi:hypothetical protein
MLLLNQQFCIQLENVTAVVLAKNNVKHILYTIAYIPYGYMVKYYFLLQSSTSYGTTFMQ